MHIVYRKHLFKIWLQFWALQSFNKKKLIMTTSSSSLLHFLILMVIQLVVYDSLSININKETCYLLEVLKHLLHNFPKISQYNRIFLRTKIWIIKQTQAIHAKLLLVKYNMTLQNCNSRKNVKNMFI